MLERVTDASDENIKRIVAGCIEQIVACDEKPGSDGFCNCGRYIMSWLMLFKRNQQFAEKRLGELEAKLSVSENRVQILTDALANYAACGDGCTCGDGWDHTLAIEALEQIKEAK